MSLKLSPDRRSLPTSASFRFQAGRQYGQTHDLDEADVLFFDMVKLRVRMVQAQGMLLRRQVVPQHQIQLVVAAPPSGDGGDGVVGGAIGLRQDHGVLIGVSSPGVQDPVRQSDEFFRIAAGQTDHGHGPFDNAGFYLRESLRSRLSRLVNGSPLHGKGIMTALEMIVSQDRAAHNGKVRVGTYEIVGELADEIQHLAEAGVVDLHGRVFRVKYDAVLIVIHVGRVLQEPGLSVNGDGDRPVVLAGGMIQTSRVALVAVAELASGVGGGAGSGLPRWPWDLFPAWTD